MAALVANMTMDEVDEEIVFNDILISTLDAGAEDYADKLAAAEHNRSQLEERAQTLHALQAQSQPQRGTGMDGNSGRPDAFWQTTMNGRPQGGNDFESGLSAASSGSKRPLPYNLTSDDDQHPFKRSTPDLSTAGTPASSSSDSLELIDFSGNPSRTHLDQRARDRQLAAEAAHKRRQEAERADNLFAQSLSQQQSRPRSAFAPSTRPGIQTTIGYNGSFQRPVPPVKTEPSYSTPSSSAAALFPTPFSQYPVQQPQGYDRKPQMPSLKMEPQVSKLKSEIGSSASQVAQRPRPFTGVVDLTADDSDDDADISEIAPNNFTPSRRAPRPAVTDPYGMLQMPGAYPTPTPSVNPLAAHQLNLADERVRQQYAKMRGAQLAMQNAIGGVKYAAGSVSGQLRELSGLINGSSSGPYNVDDDEDLVYGGSRQRPLGEDPLNPYAGQDELYRNRFDTLAAYDPAKSKEEINALLENIRPDEDMPAHLRVQTPEAMTIKLHKYQELGLTWLQKCEEGSNKGGILADDMGLGKTIQMLSLMVTRKSTDPRCKTTLVIAPVALMRQWAEEIKTKIKPGHHALSVYTHHGGNKKKSFRDLQVYDVVLTTFGSLAAEVKKQEVFRLRQLNDVNARPYPREQCALIGEDIHWYRVILDEAQCIKNRSTQTAKGAYMLNAKYRFCMTGTPMMNNVDELFSLVHFLRIKPYSSWEKYRSDFSNPMRSGGEELKKKSMRMLQALCKAVMIRRTKKSMFEGKPILVLPERTTEVANPEFDSEEAAFYQALEQRTALQFNKYLKAGTVGKSYSAILVLLLRLRQACCHPHLIRDFGVSAAADVTPDDLVKLAEQLAPQVVARIKEKDGNFECAVCYDAAINPAIFIPCGHDTCSDCFARLTDPANAIAAGNGDGGVAAKCPNCRGPIDSKRVTDFDSFKKAHQRELLTPAELAELDPMAVDEDDSDSDSDTESGDGSETESDDDVDQNGNLTGFVVKDDVDSETASEADEDNVKYEDPMSAGPATANGKAPSSRKSKHKKSKGEKKSKKAKGKEKEKSKIKKNVTLADLKKLSTKSRAARKAYLRRLQKDWITSAKIEKTMELLKVIMDAKEGEKVLIFSQWTSLLDLVEIPIDREGWGYRRYDGSMNANQRSDAVDQFRDPKENVRIMLVSLKAGNAGLNLNMASQVIILDPFWNPYIEEQAIDRAHRIGQTRPVQVHRVLIKNTVEDRIIKLQEQKRATISEVLDEKAHQSISRLGVQELAYLFGVTANPRQAVTYVPQRAR